MGMTTIRALALVALAVALPLTPTRAAEPPVAPVQSDEDARLSAQINDRLAARDLHGVIDAADALMARHDAVAAQESRTIYSAETPELTLLYALQGATTKTSVVVMDRSWALAPFTKGFVLIDLGRRDEALPYLRKAVALSPLNSQYLAELAEWYKRSRDWDPAVGLFRKAEAAAKYSPQEIRQRDLMRAKRGVGFVLIEKGQLDDAATIFRECLSIDANDAMAKNELAYIAEVRARTPH
jgi:tetratricopeptide (TPR) repeat protein